MAATATMGKATVVATSAEKKRKQRHRSPKISTYGIFLMAVAIGLLCSFQINYYHFEPPMIPNAKNALPSPRSSAASNAASNRQKQRKALGEELNGSKNTKKVQKAGARDYWGDYLHRQKSFLAEQSRNDSASMAALARKLFVDPIDETTEDTNAVVKSENTNSKDDPWFVLHIGPPKTATTTIQCGLEKHALRLAKTDNYHFLGGGCGVPLHEYYMPNGEQTVLRRSIILGLHGSASSSASSSFHSPVTKTNEGMYADGKEHLKRFVSRTRSLLKAKKSVVLSGEQFGSQLGSHSAVMTQTRDMLVDPTTGAGFPAHKVRIVLAYRHFVDWLPSFYYQKHFSVDHEMDREWLVLGRRGKPNTSNNNANNTTETNAKRVKPFLEYAEKYLSNWEEHQSMIEAHRKAQNEGSILTGTTGLLRHPGMENGKETPSQNGDENHLDLLPKDRQSIHPSWWLYKLWSSYFSLPNQVQVYDMHSPMNSNRPNDDMVTNFVCHMLPDASNTCSKLMALEDERMSNQTSNDEVNIKALSSIRDNEPDYDNLQLHSRFSMLFPNREDPTMGVGDASANQALSLRPSSDHHATRVVEALLSRGEIQSFPYEAYGPAYFKTRSIGGTASQVVKGYTKIGLVQITRALLDKYGISVKKQQQVSPTSERFSDKYFDCMPKDLEDRLLRASSTFLDLMYKHTPMLSLATASTHLEDAHEAAIEDEKEQRWIQARTEHSRLFDKNKAKGKYCDINPDKVFSAFPSLYKALTSVSYKPSYRHFKYSELPDFMMEHAKTLGFTPTNWAWPKKNIQLRKTEWRDLSPDQKAASFALGWDENTW